MDKKIFETSNGKVEWYETSIEIDLNSFVKLIHGENFSGEFIFLDTKYICVKGKVYGKKELVSERLKDL